MKTEIIRKFRALIVKNDYMIGAYGYNIFKYNFLTKEKTFEAKVCDRKNALLSRFFLTRRLFRAEITNLYTLSSGNQIVIAKKGIFKRIQNAKKFTKCFSIKRGSRPLNLCIDNLNNIYFGEYFSNEGKKSVNIYKSEDDGNTWEITYTFPSESINHIHGIFFDTFTNLLWVVTGDRDNECIIGYTSDGFKTLNIVFRGGQEYRSCNLLFYKDFIVFATDSQYIQNSIKYFNRLTLEIKELQKIQGSAIKGGQYGDVSFISTTVEPSSVNKDKYSHLWITKNGIDWKEYFSEKKDCLPSIFQFGTIEFPIYFHMSNTFYFYGRALKRIGGNTVKIEL